MDAHFYRHLAYELIPRLLHQRIQTIYSPAPKIFTLKFGAGVFLLIGTHHAGPFLFVTDTKPDNPSEPPAEVMRLRKYVTNRRVVSAMVCWPKRQMALGLSPGQGRFLLLDFDTGLSLVDEIPADFLDEPPWPNLDEITSSPNIWKSYPQLTPLVRAELKVLPENDCSAWYERLKIGQAQGFWTFMPDNSRMEAVLWKPSPRPQSPDQPREHATALEAAAYVGAWLLGQGLNQKAKQETGLVRHRRKLKGVLARLDQDQKRLEDLVYRVWMGQAIQAHLYSLDRTVKVDALRLPGADGQLQDIALDGKLTVLENMERFFKQAAKGRRGLVHLARRRAEIQAELEQATVSNMPTGGQQAPIIRAQRSTNKAGQQKGSLPVHRFQTTDGFIVIRGKNKSANHKLLSQVAKAHDFWFHAADGPGAHVVLKRDSDVQEVPERSLTEAAALAGLASHYKTAGRARVICAKVKDVRKVKGFDLGQVLVDRVWRMFDVELPSDLEKQLQKS